MTEAHQATASNADPSILIPFERWLEGRNLTRTTGYRYRKHGLIRVVNIFGRLYITRAEVQDFDRRAVNGDFALKAHPPVPPLKGTSKRVDQESYTHD